MNAVFVNSSSIKTVIHQHNKEIIKRLYDNMRRAADCERPKLH